MDSKKSGNEDSAIFSSAENEKPTSPVSRVPKALAVAASTVIILAGIQAASSLVGPILLALFLAVILLVPLRWIQKHGCPQLLAFLIVLVCTIALFVGIAYVVSQSLTNEIRNIPVYKNRITVRYAELEKQLAQLGFFIEGLTNKILPESTPDKPDEPKPVDPEPVQPEPVAPFPSPKEPLPVVSAPENTDEILDPDDGEPSDSEEEIKGEDEVETTLSPEEQEAWVQKATTIAPPSLIALDLQNVALWITRLMLYARSMLEGGFLVLIFTIFMLFEASLLPEKVNRAFGVDGPLNIKHFHRIAEDIRRYLFLKTLANLMSGSAAMFVYYMFGVPAWYLWGIIAFFMYYIPNVGGTLAAVLPGILILMTHGVPGVLLYIVCLITLECTIAYGIEPKMLGHGLRLSTLVIILSLFFWGFLLGAIGLFLAAPLTVMLKIILQVFPETRWLAVFLDGGRDSH